MKKTFTLAIVLLLAETYLIAQPGTFDSSFGINGLVIRKNILAGYDKVFTTANNKILAVEGIGYPTPAYVTQYSKKGIPEKKTELSLTYVEKVITQPDGKFLAVGNGVVMRFNNEGKVDSSFGNNGSVPYYEGGAGTEISEFILQPDNKPLLELRIIWGDIPDQIRLLRYLPNGSPDLSFGNNGILDVPESQTIRHAGIALQNDGKIILFGNIAQQFYFSRTNADGSPDMSFGNAGMVTLPTPYGIEGSLSVEKVVVQPDNKIVALGSAKANFFDYYSIIARLQPNGPIDNSFGADGFIRSPLNPLYSSVRVNAIAYQPDNKLVIACTMQGGPKEDNQALIRLNNNGSFDNTFGNNGFARPILNNNLIITSLALQQDGKIVIGGVSKNEHPFLARYKGDDIVTAQAKNPGSTALILRTYPNPVTNVLTVEIPDNFIAQKIDIVDASGTLRITQKTITENKTAIVNVRNLQPGIYYVRIADKSGKTLSTIVTKN